MDPKVLVEFEPEEREKETFILMGDFVNRNYNSFVAPLLSFNIKTKMSIFEKYVKEIIYSRTEKALEKALEGLDKMISRDPRLADHLERDVVQTLTMMLKFRRYITPSILVHAAGILSHAKLETCRDLIIELAIPFILMHARSQRLPDFFLCPVVTALTRLAAASPAHVKRLLESRVLSFFSECIDGGTTILDNIAKCMVYVCRTNDNGFCTEQVLLYDPIPILERILGMHSGYYVHMERACYALQYLSYERHVDLDESTIYNIVKLSCHQDSGVAGSALGVLGNIARWGYPSQIQFMGSNTPFELAIERGLSDRPMRFQWELCLIISKVCDHILHFAQLTEVFQMHANVLVGETILAILCAQDSRRNMMRIGRSEAFKVLNKILKFNALLIALKKHPDTRCFAKDLQPVSFLGRNDNIIKMDDLKLLYRTYVTDSLSCGQMEEDKLAALNQLRNIFGFSEKEVESITLEVTSHAYHGIIVQCMISGSLEAAENKPNFLQNLCDKLNFNSRKAIEIHEGIYRQKLNESDKDVQSLKRIQTLLCIPEESTSRIHATFSSKS